MMALSRMIDNLRSDMLECPICLEKLVEARILPCLHPFCQSCLTRHIDERQQFGSFSCPMCRRTCYVPYEGVAGFRAIGKDCVHLHFTAKSGKRVVRINSFSTRLPGDERYRSTGLFINEERFITTDRENTKVKVFDRATGALQFVMNKDQHQLQSPRDVTCNQHGEIFVTDSEIKGVLKYDSQGNLMKATPDMFRGHGYIACRDDQLVVTDPTGRLLITDFDCNIKQVIDKDSLGLDVFQPRFVSFDNRGHLVVSDWDGDRVYVIDPTVPALLQKYAGFKRYDPHGICVDQWGNLLVADLSGCSVKLIDTHGEWTEPMTSRDVTAPSSVAVTGVGEVAVLEWSTGNVKIFKYLDWA